MVISGLTLNRACVDLIRALSAVEARSLVNGTTSSDGDCTLCTDTETWTCAPVGDDWRVTLPSGKSATASTVANALAAAKLLP